MKLRKAILGISVWGYQLLTGNKSELIVKRKKTIIEIDTRFIKINQINNTGSQPGKHSFQALKLVS